MTLVVGAAIVHEGRVLAARRMPPSAGWEFPGGKVEPDETPEAALAREVYEELGLVVTVDRWLTGPLLHEVEISRGVHLRVALATLQAGEPTLREHDAVRWLAPDQLPSVDWLVPDRPFLAPLAAHLAVTPA